MAQQLFDNIHPGAFDASQFDKQQFFARLTTGWREPSSRLNDARQERGQAIPERVWLLSWENLSRPMQTTFDKELIPPTPGQALRDGTWKRHIEAFGKANCPIRSPMDVNKYDGLIFYVEQADLVFGTDRKTGQVFKATNVILPLRIATQEEITALLAIQEAGSGAVQLPPEALIESITGAVVSYLGTGPSTRDDLLDAVEGTLNESQDPTIAAAVRDTVTQMEKDKLIAFNLVEGTVELTKTAAPSPKK